MKIVITGAAGAVGQNLVKLLDGKYEIVAIDKHRFNLDFLKKNRKVTAVLADVSKSGEWEKHLKGADVLVSLQAQISSTNPGDFDRNTVRTQENLCRICKKQKVKYIVHVSSSVVISVADDDYTRTKREQEEVVKNCGLPYVVLRPTLMFGWYDKKHLTYLAKFLEKSFVFPIPGDGRITRQPLYVVDFCRVLESCIKTRPKNKEYNIIGKEKIYYKELIREIRDLRGLNTLLLPIPIWLFRALLDIYALFVKNPPFTSDQLQALINDDVNTLLKTTLLQFRLVIFH